jgi:hypothetical protein
MEKGIDVEEVFRRLVGKQNDKISQDELLIAMSRISDAVSLGDVKELHRILVGAYPGNNAGIEDVKVSLVDAISILTL